MRTSNCEEKRELDIHEFVANAMRAFKIFLSIESGSSHTQFHKHNQVFHDKQI